MTQNHIIKLIDIQKEYYAILEEFYLDFYNEFKNSTLDKREYILTLIRKKIILPKGGNNFSIKRYDFLTRIKKFWDKNYKEFYLCINKYKNKGFYGTTENITTHLYESEIKQNALYFDLILLNDPFYYPVFNAELDNYKPNILFFYESIINIFEIKKYILCRSDLIYTVMCPTMFPENDSTESKMYVDNRNRAIYLCKEVFALNYEEPNLIRDMEKLKALSDEEISRMFDKNGFIINLREAQKYEYALAEDVIISTSNELFGQINHDFIRCVLNYRAIINLTTTRLVTYDIHCKQAKSIKANPILDIYEWQPLKLQYSNLAGLPASAEYKYTCAVQRNDKISIIVEMTSDEILKFRQSNDSIAFRKFMNTITNEISHTPECFDEIATETFEKLKEFLQKEYDKLNLNRRQRIRKAVFGLAKGISGFVPYLSYISTPYDIFESVKDVAKSVKRDELIIDNLITKLKDSQE